ncbi:hypothetical protein, partial [Rikenella microfusus]|uniref:hypothetical protein n=1 Tax=Rikenella microfusus TaxID=28139 RepID=UPI001DB1DCD6
RRPITVRLITMFSLSQAGATPGEGLQLAKLVWASLAPAIKLTVPFNIPSLFHLFIYRIEAAGPGMCDFPFRRKSGTGNRIPGDFFAFFLGPPRKKVPCRHEASGETGAPRYKRAKKNKRLSAKGIQLKTSSRASGRRSPWGAWARRKQHSGQSLLG